MISCGGDGEEYRTIVNQPGRTLLMARVTVGSQTGPIRVQRRQIPGQKGTSVIEMCHNGLAVGCGHGTQCAHSTLAMNGSSGRTPVTLRHRKGAGDGHARGQQPRKWASSCCDCLRSECHPAATLHEETAMLPEVFAWHICSVWTWGEQLEGRTGSGWDTVRRNDLHWMGAGDWEGTVASQQPGRGAAWGFSDSNLEGRSTGTGTGTGTNRGSTSTDPRGHRQAGTSCLARQARP